MEILISLSVVLLAGFLLTRLTKLAKLPDVTGYIIAGILIGPHILKLVPPRMIEDMGFISDIALAFIAFGVGRFFRKEVFRETGFGVITITLMESLLAGVIVTLSLHYLFHLDWDFSLLLGAIGTATAPASTTVTIRQYHARGNFVNILLQVVALDDGVCLIVYSIALAIVNAGDGAGVCVSEIVLPIIFNILALALGFVGGFILSRLKAPKRSDDDRVILTISLLLGIAGLCVAVDISPLLSCMIFGTTYVNLAKDRELFKHLDRLSPPIFSLFFVVSGMSLDLSTLGSMGVIGASYFVIRILGKYIGAYLAVVPGLDALVFTAGIGENSASAREHICRGLEHLGIRLDPVKNHAPSRAPREIQQDGVPLKILVLPTNEELQIALETKQIIEGHNG